MKKILLSMVLAVASASISAAQGPAPAGQPAAAPPSPAFKVGDKAPEFTLQYLVAKPEGGFERKTVSLADYRDKQNVVLAFFPAAFSPG